jgi:chaperonin GroES
MAKIKPLQDKILLKIEEKKDSEKEEIVGGIIIPKKDEDKSIKYGIVEEISPELKDVSICVGDKVLYSKYSGTEIEIDNKEYLLISYKDIQAKIEF